MKYFYALAAWKLSSIQWSAKTVKFSTVLSVPKAGRAVKTTTALLAELRLSWLWNLARTKRISLMLLFKAKPSSDKSTSSATRKNSSRSSKIKGDLKFISKLTLMRGPLLEQETALYALQKWGKMPTIELKNRSSAMAVATLTILSHSTVGVAGLTIVITVWTVD